MRVKKIVSDVQSQWGTGQEILSQELKVKLFDPRSRFTEDMIGKMVDIALLIPSAEITRTVTLDKKYSMHNPKCNFYEDGFCGYVKEAGIKDVWHEEGQYARLVRIESWDWSVLVNPDEATYNGLRFQELVKVKPAVFLVLDVKDHFVRDIEEHMLQIERLKELIVKNPPNIKNLYYMGGRDSFQIAVCYMRLGDQSRARQWSGTAVDYFDKSRTIGSTDEPLGGGYALYPAVMSGDRGLMKSAAEKVKCQKYLRKLDMDYVETFLADAIVGDDDGAKNVAAELDERERTMARSQRYNYGLGALCLGLANRDPAMFKAGMRESLATHRNKAIQTGEGLAGGLICLPAACVALLAAERGIKIIPDDVGPKYREYLPWCLLS